MSGIPIIKTDNEEGKQFISKVENLLKKVFPDPITNKEKLRRFKQLSDTQIENNEFLLDFLLELSEQGKHIFDNLELRRVFMGNFGRKGSSVFAPINKEYFRILLHLGDTEVYYLDTETEKDKPVVLQNGEGMIIPSFSSTTTSICVYQDPIRILYNSTLQSKLPKIRPRNYDRINVIYDFELNPSFFSEESD